MQKILFLIFVTFIYQTSFAQDKINPQNIQIARDSFGVPHIFAKTDAEVAYGLAWANAEDDFESMQHVIIPAKGLMGKVMGKKGAAGDYAFALFRCKEITEEKWSTLSVDYMKVLEAYVQSMNDYAATHSKEVLAKGLFPITTKEMVASSVLALTVFNGADAALGRIFSNQIPVVIDPNKKGSNSMAIHKSKTTTNENYLVINAHQPNTGAQSFYEAHVCSEEGWNATGGLLAGGTSILHGVNEYLGWAHTVNYCDRVDVFQLEMNPQNNLQYKFDDKWETLEKRKIKLRIKGIPIKIGRNVYWSKYGATMKNKQGFFSIRVGANMKIGALDQWYQMNKAKNYTEFYKILQQQELSMFNIMYADKYDTIFYVNNALMPVRNPDTKYKWKSTVLGNGSQTLWTKFRSIQEAPQYINPTSGFLFNTNHSSFLATGAQDNLSANKFPLEDGWETLHNNRSKRFLELMPTTEKVDLTLLKKIKFDMQLPSPLSYPHNIDTFFMMSATEYPQYASIINTLKTWDKKGDATSKGGAVFLLAYLHLQQKLRGQFPRKITKEEAVGTLEYIQTYLMKNFGKTDIVLGDLQKLVRGDKEYPLGGFPDLLAPQWTEAYKDGKLKSVGGDGLVMFVRFPQNGLPIIESVNMYGASAHKESKHFDDQVQLYLQHHTKKMSLDKAEVLQHAERIYHPGE
jgi:acyl-homoserine-lactone acylase